MEKSRSYANVTHPDLIPTLLEHEPFRPLKIDLGNGKKYVVHNCNSSRPDPNLALALQSMTC